MSRFLVMLAAAVMAALLIAGSPAQAEESVALTYDPPYEVGSQQLTELESKTVQTLTIAGMAVETKAETFIKTSEAVVAANAEKGWNWEGAFTFVQSEMELPGGVKVSFNSNNPDKEDSNAMVAVVVEALRATAGAKWTAQTNGEHQITKMEYVDDPFAKVDAMLKGTTSPESIMKAHTTELGRYPADPVKPGDKWTRTEASDLGGGQSLSLEKEYTYVGSEDRDGRTLDKVTAKALKVEYHMDPNSPSPAKVTDSNLEVVSSDGTYWYDREARVFTDRNDKVAIKGTLTMEFNGQKLPSELDLAIDTTARTKLAPPK